MRSLEGDLAGGEEDDDRMLSDVRDTVSMVFEKRNK
jgi:hypothetical protein